MNLDNRTVMVDGQPVRLTSKEYALLELLSMRKGAMLSKEVLLDHLYGDEDEAEELEEKLRKNAFTLDDFRKQLRTIKKMGPLESILGIGYLIPLVYLTWSLAKGEDAGPNPWGARGLEWEIPSPPPTENFAVTPVVTHGTHQYAPSNEVGIV